LVSEKPVTLSPVTGFFIGIDPCHSTKGTAWNSEINWTARTGYSGTLLEHQGFVLSKTAK